MTTTDKLDEELLNEQGWAFVDWMKDTGSTMSGHAFNGIKPKLREIILAHRRASQAAPAPSDGLREAATEMLSEYDKVDIQDGEPASMTAAVLALRAALSTPTEERQ